MVGEDGEHQHQKDHWNCGFGPPFREDFANRVIRPDAITEACEIFKIHERSSSP